MCRMVSKKREEGMALIAALATISLMVLFGSVFVVLSKNETKGAWKDKEAVRAFYIAEAAAQKAIRKLALNNSWQGESQINFGGGSYTVSVDSPVDGYQTIVARGEIGGVSRAVEVKIRQVDIPALLYAYFANSELKIHNHGIPGMTLYANCWSNGDFILNNGTRLHGDASALGHMIIGNHNIGDSCVVYGDLRASSIDIEQDAYILAREEDPIHQLAAADGDVTVLDSYVLQYVGGEWTGDYDLFKDAGTIWNQGEVEGELNRIDDGTPPSENTIVERGFPIPNYDLLRDLAMTPPNLYFTSQSALEAYMADTSHSHRVFDPDVGSEIVVYDLIADVIFVEGKVKFDKKSWQPNRLHIEGAFIPFGGLEVQIRYEQVAPDSFPAIISTGKVSFDKDGNPAPIPADIEGLVYSEDQIHLHREEAVDRVFIRGAEMADVIHNCKYYTVEYDPNIQKLSWLFEADDSRTIVVSWRQR